MSQTTAPALFALLCGIASHVSAAEVPNLSWRGDKGVFPAQGLVTSFACDTAGKGQNIVWRADLPNWGANAPIVVKDKVFVMCQEGVDIQCPQLLCFDVNSGKLLWQKPVDHLDAWSEDKAKEAKEIRRKEHARWAKFMRWCHRLYWDADKNGWKEGRAGQSSKKPAEISAETQALLKEAEADSLKMNSYWGTGISLDALNRGRFGLGEMINKDEVNNFNRCVTERIYWYPGWASEGPFYGSVMGSVVSDGQCIYAITALDTAACYDLEGNRRWVADMAPTFIHTGKNPAPGNRWNTNISSPVLADGKLIYFHRDGWMMYAYDCASGKLAWKVPAPMETTIRPRGSAASPNYAVPQGYQGHMGPGGTPVTMVVGGTSVVVSGHGMVVRLNDGKYLGMVQISEAADKDENSPDAGKVFGGAYNSWVADGDTLYAVAMDKGLASFRLRLEGDKLISEKRWCDKELGQSEGPNLALFQGHLYGSSVRKKGFAELDPNTGTAGACGPAPAGWTTGWAISRDGIAIYKTSGDKKSGDISFTIAQLPGMKVLGQGKLDDTPTPEQVKNDVAMLGMGPVNPGPAGITAFGNRIFFRSNHHLWCIGDTGKPFTP